jgi:hypothetical protein
MKAICINDSDKPEQIPQEEWIEEGVVYTVSKITRMGFQKDKFGLALEEIQLTSKSMPFELYDAERFIIIPFAVEIDGEYEIDASGKDELSI